MMDAKTYSITGKSIAYLLISGPTRADKSIGLGKAGCVHRSSATDLNSHASFQKCIFPGIMPPGQAAIGCTRLNRAFARHLFYPA